MRKKRKKKVKSVFFLCCCLVNILYIVTILPQKRACLARWGNAKYKYI